MVNHIPIIFVQPLIDVEAFVSAFEIENLLFYFKLAVDFSVLPSDWMEVVLQINQKNVGDEFTFTLNQNV